MFSVSQGSVTSQDNGPSLADLSSANGDYVRPIDAGAVRLPDELSIEDLADDREAVLAMSQADSDAIAEMIDDQTISQADALHRAEARQIRETAKALTGAESVKVSRVQLIDDYADPGTIIDRTEWQCFLHGPSGDHCAMGTGDTADEALTKCLADLDQRISGTTFGCLRVAHRAVIGAWPHRSRDAALAMARRIALNVQYLDECVRYELPGVIDERPQQQRQQPTPPRAA
jgi:hypothetical protein